MGFINLLGGMGVRLPPQARANLSGRRAGALEPVGGRAREAKKPPVFLVKRLAQKVFTRDLDHKKFFWLMARCRPLARFEKKTAVFFPISRLQEKPPVFFEFRDFKKNHRFFSNSRFGKKPAGRGIADRRRAGLGAGHGGLAG